MEVKQFIVAQVTLQMLPYAHGTYAYGCASKKQIANLQGHKTTDVSNNVVHTEQHIGSTSLLHSFSIYIEMKVQPLHIASNLSQRYKITNSSRAIEPLAKFPWITHLAETALHVASCKIDTHRHSIIITMSETRRDTLAQATDANYHFGFIMHFVRKIRKEKRFAILQDSRVGLQKNHRLLVFLLMPQLTVVQGIVHSYSYNLHYLISLKLRRLNITAK